MDPIKLPQISNGADTESIAETDTTISSSGNFIVSDVDTNDTVSATVTAVALSGTFIDSSSTLPSSLSDNNNQALINMLDLTIASGSNGTDSASDHIVQSVDADSTNPSTINWEFRSGDADNAAFDFLRADETLVLTYTIALQDSSGDVSSDTSNTSVAITVTGSNDSPSITEGDDSSQLTETNTTLTDDGTMTVTDIDLTDTVTPTVESVEITGTTGSITANDVPLSSDQLKSMLSLGATTSSLEHGSINEVNHEWQTIQLEGTYINPVVILSDPIGSTGNTDEIAPRLRNISSNSFEVRLVEPSNRDDEHGMELLNYMVIESGNWTLADGTKVSAGTTTLSSYETNETITFGQTIDPPTILTQLQTFSNQKYAVTRTRSVSKNGFNTLMETGDGMSTNNPQEETVGWIAIESINKTLDDNTTIEAVRTDDIFDEQTKKINFTANFNSTPRLFTKIATYGGSDAANTRVDIDNLNANRFKLFIQEETTQDSEQDHTTERIFYIAIEDDDNLIPINRVGSTSTPEDLPANPSAGSEFGWTFESGAAGDSAFNFLAEGETLELTYNIQVADDSAAINESPTDTSTVVVTITGTNDKPDITIVDVTGDINEDNLGFSLHQGSITETSEIQAGQTAVFDWDQTFSPGEQIAWTHAGGEPTIGIIDSNIVSDKSIAILKIQQMASTRVAFGGWVGGNANWAGLIGWDNNSNIQNNDGFNPGKEFKLVYEMTDRTTESITGSLSYTAMMFYSKPVLKPLAAAKHSRFTKDRNTRTTVYCPTFSSPKLERPI